jgi:CheY-like chemotaxis protein
VLTAADGQEALELLRRPPGQIHMVLSDLVMPRLGGRGLYDAVRREDTPFLLRRYSPETIAHLPRSGCPALQAVDPRRPTRCGSSHQVGLRPPATFHVPDVLSVNTSQPARQSIRAGVSAAATRVPIPHAARLPRQ